MEELNLKSYAYIGDAVWELFVREHTVRETANAKELHKNTIGKVNASFQAKLLEEIHDILTEEEKEITRRGRNLSIPVARKSEQATYRQATAFEVLIGWLHSSNKERLEEIEKNLEKFL